MKQGLWLLSDLADEDVAWLLDNGTEKQVIANTIILEEGRAPESLVFVVEGLVGVRISALPNQQLAAVGPGEMFGEMSFIEGGVASATVGAVENSLLLEIPFAALRREADARPAFAARLYRAFALTAARRLKAREKRFEQLAGFGPAAFSETPETVEKLDGVLADFKRVLQEADQAALKNDGVLSPTHEVAVRDVFRTFASSLNEQIGDESGVHEALRAGLGARAQREALPYLLLTKTTERLYSKPRGYAGDFLSIEWMYENKGQGIGRLGPLLDDCFLHQPAARAVQNRRGLLVREILDHVDRNPDRTVKITTMACGPAREVFDVFEKIDDPTRMEVTLIDIDQEALDFVRKEVERRGLERQIRLFHGNLVYLALGRQKIDLADQDLMYSIGLIDYFNDKFVRNLINYGYKCLRSGGELILGNFHPRNTDKALMDFVLDWQLIHRNEDDMNRLYEESLFGRPTTAIHYEETRVNLFAACIKS